MTKTEIDTQIDLNRKKNDNETETEANWTEWLLPSKYSEIATTDMDPGSGKYLRIVEEFIKYVENISISSSKETKYCQNKYIGDKYVISRLIIIIIVEFDN